MIDLNQHLSKNFQLWEFVISQTAQRFGIDNTPTERTIKNLKHLCGTILQPARDVLGPFYVSSGLRVPLLNRLVGGSPTSDHQYGWCGDVIPLAVPKLEFARWIVKNVPFDQVILEFGTKSDPAWIHVSASPKNRKQILRIMSGTGYVPITYDQI